MTSDYEIYVVGFEARTQCTRGDCAWKVKNWGVPKLLKIYILEGSKIVTFWFVCTKAQHQMLQLFSALMTVQDHMRFSVDFLAPNQRVFRDTLR